MTYIELCKEALKSADTGSPGGLNSLRDADEYQKQVTGYVNEAWRFIQNIHDSWGWRQKEFKAVLRPGVDAYEWNELRQQDGEKSIPLDPGFSDWLSRAPNAADDDGPAWLLTSPTEGPQTFGELAPIAFDAMRVRRLIVTTQSRPTLFSFTPDKKLLLHAIPVAAYVVNGMYVIGVQELTSENHVPFGLPAKHHEIIKWRAVMMLHGSDEAAESWAFAERQYREMLSTIERLYLPSITVGGSLA